MPHFEPTATDSQSSLEPSSLSAFSTGQATATTTELSTHPVVESLLGITAEPSAAELKDEAFSFLSKISPEVTPTAEQRQQLLKEQASLLDKLEEAVATYNKETTEQTYQTFSEPVLQLIDQGDFSAATNVATAFSRYFNSETYRQLDKLIALKSNDLLRHVIAERQYAGQDHLIRIPVPTLTLESSEQEVADYVKADRDSLVTVHSPELIHKDDLSNALTSKIVYHLLHSEYIDAEQLAETFHRHTIDRFGVGSTLELNAKEVFGAVLLLCEHSEASVSADELKQATEALTGVPNNAHARTLPVARAERYLFEKNAKIVSQMGYQELDSFLETNDLKGAVRLELQTAIRNHVKPVGETIRQGDLEEFEKAVRLPTKTGVKLIRAMKSPELMTKEDMSTMFRSYVNLFLHRGDLQSALGMAGRFRSHAQWLKEQKGQLEQSEWKEIERFCENVAASRSKFTVLSNKKKA